LAITIIIISKIVTCPSLESGLIELPVEVTVIVSATAGGGGNIELSSATTVGDKKVKQKILKVRSKRVQVSTFLTVNFLKRIMPP